MANDLEKQDKESQLEPRFTPILFDDGTQYTSEEVEWVVNDYLNRAERSIVGRRAAAKYQMKLRGTASDDDKSLPVQQTERDKFLAKVKAANDYDWIIAVVMVRKELDPMHSLRVKIFDRKPVGGSTFDIMLNHINEVLRDTKSTYADRARAEYYRKFINEIYKDWTPASPKYIPSVNFITQFNNGDNRKDDTKEPVRVSLSIDDIRKKMK